jgi:hypothetical protein
MSRGPERAIVPSKACFIPIWIISDRAFEHRKIKPCARSRLG